MLCSGPQLSYLQTVGSFWNCFETLSSGTTEVCSLELIFFLITEAVSFWALSPKLTSCGLFPLWLWEHRHLLCVSSKDAPTAPSAASVQPLSRPWVILSCDYADRSSAGDPRHPLWISLCSCLFSCVLPWDASSLGLPQVFPLSPLIREAASLSSPALLPASSCLEVNRASGRFVFVPQKSVRGISCYSASTDYWFLYFSVFFSSFLFPSPSFPLSFLSSLLFSSQLFQVEE